jgi:hypothetical protein
MKKFRIILFVLLFATCCFAQKVKKDNWIRVQSDDGEFSIEIPAKHSYFYDDKGFILASWGYTIKLTEMSVLNAYIGDTLVNFERYKAETIQPTNFKNADKSVFDKSSAELAMLKLSQENPKYLTIQKVEKGWLEINKGKYKIGQLTRTGNEEFTIKQYFFSDNFVYILTASSRKGKTPEITRFLDSLRFKSTADKARNKNAVSFSGLNRVTIKVFEDLEPKEAVTQEKSPKISSRINKSFKPLLIISNSGVPYTREASEKLLKGIIRLETTFAKSGQITKIIVRRTPDHDLIHNAVLTILRMKYLPALKNGKPISVVKKIDYEFTGY